MAEMQGQASRCWGGSLGVWGAVRGVTGVAAVPGPHDRAMSSLQTTDGGFVGLGALEEGCGQ